MTGETHWTLKKIFWPVKMFRKKMTISKLNFPVMPSFIFEKKKFSFKHLPEPINSQTKEIDNWIILFFPELYTGHVQSMEICFLMVYNVYKFLYWMRKHTTTMLANFCSIVNHLLFMLSWACRLNTLSTFISCRYIQAVTSAVTSVNK